ncbi:MAG: PRC-barrel domain-containing protein [Actinomycetota bacterium]|nr:PRC-barrel domain-containing protein [Actinomycetota bacterium]
MADTMQFTISAEASCSDGVCGTVSRVIVDPLTEAVTHLVVEPKHRRDSSRLVPLELLDGAAGEVRLRCTRAEFEKLDPAQETQFIPATNAYGGYSPGQVDYWPYYGLGGGMRVGGMPIGGMGLGGGSVSQTVTRDTVPVGEVDVRRGEPVHATDGDIGRVQGLVIDPGSRHLTHVLLQEGHLWGRKEVAIPIGAVASTANGIQLRISKQEVKDLPPVDIDHPDGDGNGGTGGRAEQR